MPTKTTKTTRHSSNGYEEVYTATTVYKASVRRTTTTPTVVNPLPHWNCIWCDTEYSGLINGVFGRVLKGFRVKMGKKIILVDYPDPTRSKQFPEYRKGRVCDGCSRKLTITNKAPLVNEIQFLRDAVDIRPHHHVTPDMIAQMDEDIEKYDEQERQDKLGFVQTGRIKIPLGTGKFASGGEQKEHTVCVHCKEHNGRSIPRCSKCGKPTLTESLVDIAPNAFRRFMNSRGGLKNYESNMIKQFDTDINYSNIKRG